MTWPWGLIRILRMLRVFLETTGASTIWATNWHKASVIPAKAGIHPPSVPWMPAFAGMTNREGCRGAEISYSVAKRKLMDTSW
jgi:hypothetical protein